MYKYRISNKTTNKVIMVTNYAVKTGFVESALHTGPVVRTILWGLLSVSVKCIIMFVILINNYQIQFV